MSHRSVSQLQLYDRCPMAYKLSKVDKVWKRPAAWLVQGSAVHETIERWELSQRTLCDETLVSVFTDSYAKYANAALAETPNLAQWFASGPYAGEADLSRRFDIGLEQVGRYQGWVSNHPEEVIWITPDGTPGIEIEFDIDLDGVQIRGFIDAILDTPEGIVVRDHKTGNHPGSDFQLGVYAVALSEVYGIYKPQIGDYWMGKTGKATYPFDLSEWTRYEVSSRFKELDQNVRAERFEAKPDPVLCKFCDVAWACEFSMA